jgi:phospholipase A1
MKGEEDMKRCIVMGILVVIGCAFTLASEAMASQLYSLGEVNGIALAQASKDEGGVEKSAWEQRQDAEKAANQSGWAILPHRPNYILPYTYNNTPNNAPYKAAGSDTELDNAEAKFQISFKLPIWEKMFGSKTDLFFAYSQISMWQVYNDQSAPFRDTNYEPEAVVVFHPDFEILGLTNRGVAFGAVHQSNGRGNDALSRSWNRVYVAVAFDRGNFACSIKPWWRIPEDDKAYPGDPDGDNNPGIEKYYGYGEFRAAYKMGNNVFAMMLRNNLRSSGNKGAIELDWSFPLTSKLKGYVQFFNGYGESMLDYDHANERIGVGVLLSDWM